MRAARASKSTNGANQGGCASRVIRPCNRRNVPGVPSASSAFLPNSAVGTRAIVSTLDTWLPE